MTVEYDPNSRWMIAADLGIIDDLPPSQDWIDDCARWRGRTLKGDYAHWCPDWDYLPIDETCSEWPCPCSMSNGITR